MFIKPSQIVNSLPVEDGMLIAEFGSGAGDFSLDLARRAPEGKVYALDVQAGTLSALSSKADSAGVYNIETIHCDLERENGSTLPDNHLDIVLIPNVLFQADDRKAFLREAYRVLKKGGRLMVLDWDEGEGLGPQKEMRVTADQVQKEAEEQGFETKKEIDAGRFHWALLFKK